MYKGKKTLSSLLVHQAEAFPNKVLFYFHGESYTYGRVNEEAAHAAAALTKLGISRGDRVIIGMTNSPEELIAFAAVARAGAIYIPTHAKFQTREIAYYLKDSEAQAVIGTQEFIHKVEECIGESDKLHLLIQVDGNTEGSVYSWTSLTKEPDTWDAGSSPDDPLAIYYTSGTTGKPKGAILLNGRFLNNSLRLGSSLHYTEKEVTVNTLPYTHVFAPIVEWIPMMFYGGHFVLRDVFHPRRVLEEMNKYRATFIAGVPAMFMAMLEEIKRAPDKYDFTELRFAFVGAAPMPLQLQTELENIMGAPFIQGSGQTESGPLLTLEPLERTEGIHPGTCGTTKIYEDIKTRIIDQDGYDVPLGDIGELIVQSPDIMAGYWRRPEETRRTIVDGWLHTGDLAREDEDGYFYLVDRKKDMIITRGQNVYPVEIENIIYNLTAVKEVAVIGLPDSIREESVEAFIVLKEGRTLTEKQVKDCCRDKLTDYKRPRHVHFVDGFPKTVSGKIRKAQFKKQLLEKLNRKLR